MAGVHNLFHAVYAGQTSTKEHYNLTFNFIFAHLCKLPWFVKASGFQFHRSFCN